MDQNAKNPSSHPALLAALRKLERLNPDHFELYMMRKVATKIEAKNKQIDSLSKSEDVGLSVRLIKDQRLGFSFTTSLDPAAIEKAIISASEIATVMPEDALQSLHSFSSSVYQNIETLDSRGLARPIDDKIALALRLEASCREADRRITGVRSASLGETEYAISMLDSAGDFLHHHSSLYTASITCKAEQGGDSQMGGEFAFANELEQLEIDGVGRRAADYATELLGAGTVNTMTCPAIIRNNVVAELLEFLASSFSAEEVDKGRSMLAGKLGQKLFSEHVTLINDGLLPGGLMTAPFDAEGVPCGKSTLVDGGFVSSFLYDLYYARKFGTAPSGCASRSIKAPPSISISNFYIPNGKAAQAHLLDGISRGVLITDLMGVHTANPVTGDFSLGASGILIEGGKLIRPIKGFAVAGNVLDVFRKISDIGNDMRFFGNVGAPSVRITDLSVSGS